MKQKNLNGGYKTTKSKSSVFRIISGSPYVTEDLAQTIKYLENVVINEHTIKTLDLTELVQNINRLLQATMVLSVFKKPCLKLVNKYQKQQEKINSLLSNSKKDTLTLEILEDLLYETGLNNIQIERKDYWEDYE
ncbi:MAG: hypothetical protein J6T10_25145 [Methanobrevibacter sp.]|nr:hypothetical protein [Methanobrevibacter sp.]